MTFFSAQDEYTDASLTWTKCWKTRDADGNWTYSKRTTDSDHPDKFFHVVHLGSGGHRVEVRDKFGRINEDLMSWHSTEEAAGTRIAQMINYL